MKVTEIIFFYHFETYLNFVIYCQCIFNIMYHILFCCNIGGRCKIKTSVNRNTLVFHSLKWLFSLKKIESGLAVPLVYAT